MGRRYRYTRWDGTQAGFELGADGLLAEVADDLLYHGDLAAALRRAMQAGLTDREGRHLPGIREILEQLKRRRQEELSRHDLGSFYDDVSRELREVVDLERASLDARQDADPAGTGERRQRLDLLPPDLAGQVRELESYPFTSEEARRRFADLVDTLRDQILRSQFHRMTEALDHPSPEEMARLKDMFAALNALLDRRSEPGRAGSAEEQADFEAFMGEYGGFFPDRPATLDQLLEHMARQMAAAQALMNSLSPEQRAELQALSDQLLADLDLRWQVDQLGSHLRAAFPDMGWQQSFAPTGADPLDLVGGAELMDRLTDLDGLEHVLRSALSPGALAEVDLDVVRELLGPDPAESLERLAELTALLREAGLVDQREGRLQLTPKGIRRLGQLALADLFGHLSADRLGGHQVDRSGPGTERGYESKPYEFGDPFHLDIERTLRNALQRRGGGLPVELEPSDFEVDRTEAVTRSSTVVALDLSLSMPMRDNFLAAKKVAMALHALISSRFPQDFLGLVGFSESARTLRPEQLPEVSWDFVWGTNLQHALVLSRKLLAGRAGSRQIVLVTDGEPTAHVLPGGDVFFHYPPTPDTLRATLAEVARCTAAGIRINTFMLDATDGLQHFVERMARINRGRVFVTTPKNLGDYVLVDFLEQKRRIRRHAG